VRALLLLVLLLLPAVLYGAAATPARPVPVVVVVLDELPLGSLLDGRGRVDERRCPTFARLAREATWYDRATTVGDRTIQAVPALLTGRYPRPGAEPTRADHPRSLFTLLEGSHAQQVHEAVTSLASTEAAGGLRVSGGDHLGRSADPVDALRRFTAGIHNAPGPDLVFLHEVVPHFPWRYLPSGRPYAAADAPFEYGRPAVARWSDDPWSVYQAHERHLRQVAFADRLLGEVLSRLRAIGLYDDAMVVVVADHGVSFRAGGNRRRLDLANHGDILPVPLFVKYPGQRVGAVDHRAAESVDVLPTVADVVGVSAGPVDGRSLRQPAVDRAVKTAFDRDDRRFEFPSPVAVETAPARSARLLAACGARADLVGRRAVGADGADEGVLEEAGAGLAPCWVRARLRLASRGAGASVAVAVNGIVRAVVPVRPSADGTCALSVLLDEAAFGPGRNDVRVYRVQDGRMSRVRCGEARVSPLQFHHGASGFGRRGR